MIRIIGYICTILCHITYYISVFCKEKRHMMAWNSLSCVFNAMQLLCFGSIAACLNLFLSMTRGLVINFKDKKQIKMYWGYGLYMLGYTLTSVFFWKGIQNVFTIAPNYIITTTQWFCTPQIIRLFNVLSAILGTIFLILIENYVGAFLEIFVIAVNIGGYIKYRRQNA